MDAVIVASQNLAGLSSSVRPRPRSDALVKAGAARRSHSRRCSCWPLRFGSSASGTAFPFSAPRTPTSGTSSRAPGAMVHGGGLDPHWFDYPTLVMYLRRRRSRRGSDEPSYLTAQASSLVGDCARRRRGRVVARRPRRTGPVAGVGRAAAVAAVDDVRRLLRMAVTDVPLTVGVTVALALMVSAGSSSPGSPSALAASAKYPGDHPARAARRRPRWGRWRRLAVGVVRRSSRSRRRARMCRLDFRPGRRATRWRVERWRARAAGSASRTTSCVRIAFVGTRSGTASAPRS